MRSPFPEKQIAELSKKVKGILVAEINAGQMVQDVRLAVNGFSFIDILVVIINRTCGILQIFQLLRPFLRQTGDPGIPVSLHIDVNGKRRSDIPRVVSPF